MNEIMPARQFLRMLEDCPAGARAYLRHPVHRGRCLRCDCDEYALLYGVMRIIDHELVHSLVLCQPLREYIP